MNLQTMELLNNQINILVQKQDKLIALEAEDYTDSICRIAETIVKICLVAPDLLNDPKFYRKDS